MKPRMIDFPMHKDYSGILAVADKSDLPFKVERIFWMWNLYEQRGQHALKTCQQLLVVPSGNMTVQTMQGITHMEVVHFNFGSKRELGLYLPPVKQ